MGVYKVNILSLILAVHCFLSDVLISSFKLISPEKRRNTLRVGTNWWLSLIQQGLPIGDKMKFYVVVSHLYIEKNSYLVMLCTQPNHEQHLRPLKQLQPYTSHIFKNCQRECALIALNFTDVNILAGQSDKNTSSIFLVLISIRC